MEDIMLGRSIHRPFRIIYGEVIWVSLDEKNVYAFSEATGEVYIFTSSTVANIVSTIDQIEDGQFVEMQLNYNDEVVSAKFIHDPLYIYNDFFTRPKGGLLN